ncbi:MAG: hypothetical protein ACOC7K_00270 [bacterium]
MPVLTAIDVLGIQSYIFASNRLRDVVGASHLVEWVTSRNGGLCFDNDAIPTPEIVVAAGGNAILRFSTTDDAKKFVLYYSRRLLEEAPELDVAIAHRPYEDGQLARGLLALQVELAKAKLNRRPHAPQLGLGVMQPCVVTGLPASSVGNVEKEWVSSRIARIRDKGIVNRAVARWQPLLPGDVDGCKVRFPDVIDQMGRSRGDTSLVGVVHIDGNGIGRRIQRWLVSKLEDTPVTDESLMGEYRRWSEALKSLGEAVLRAVVSRLTGRIKYDQKERGFFVRGQPAPPRQLDFDLKTDSDGTILLPLRPILLGGDDITFVCDGRIALDLATTALRAFQSESASYSDLKLLGHDPATACAGVALVKAHAPFNRSYELCEELCATAKREREANYDSRSWIDWHVGSARPGEAVPEIRKREYQGRKLTCRPYPLDGDDSQRLTWEWLDSALLGESTEDGASRLSLRNPEVWGERRNKVKALASLVGDGGDAVREQLEAWSSVAPDLRLPSPIQEDGFKGDRTPLLDAVELLDIHLRLNAPEPAREVEADAGEALV